MKKKLYLSFSLFLSILILSGSFFTNHAFSAGINSHNRIDGAEPEHSADYALEKKFTIKKISFPTWYEREEQAFDIEFTDDVFVNNMRSNIEFIPNVYMEWYRVSRVRNNTYRIFGRFTPGTTYFIKVSDSLRSRNSFNYKETIKSFTFPNKPSKIVFAGTESVVELHSRQLIHTRLVNVDELLVKGISIPPIAIPRVNNIIRNVNNTIDSKIEEALAGDINKYKGMMESDSDFKYLSGEPRTDSKLFFTHVSANEEREFSIPMTFRDNPDKGATIFNLVTNNLKGDPFKYVSKLHRITDLSIAYKHSPKSLLVWLTSLNTGKPIDDVKIFAASSNDTFYYLGETGSDGVLLAKENESKKLLDLKLAGGIAPSKLTNISGITHLIAVTDDDVSFISTNEASVDFKQTNNMPKNMKDQLHKGHLFTERGIYRPGETVHFKGTLRYYQAGEIKLPEVKEVKVIINNSKGENVFNETMTLSDFGTLAGDFKVKSYFPLGIYTMFMKPVGSPDPVNNSNNRRNRNNQGSSDDYARVTFQVEEFRPPRHHVEISYKHESDETDQYVGLKRDAHFINCTIEGKYYAGGPVQDGKVQWKVYYSGSDYKVKGYEDYSFSHPTLKTRELVETGESILDERGQLIIRVPVSQEVLAGNNGLEVVATVVDIDGRPATGKSHYQHEPEYMVGISRHSGKVLINEKQHLTAILLDDDRDRVKSGTLRVEVMNEGYTYIWKKTITGRSYWERKQIWRKEFYTTVPLIKGKADFDFDFSRGGTFLIRFSYRAKDGHTYNSGIRYNVQGPGYYGYYWARNNDRKEIEKNQKRLLFLQTPKAAYQVGEKVKLFASANNKLTTCLMTIERDDVLEYRVINGDDIDDLSFTTEQQHAPNVYVTLLGTMPRGEFPVYGTEVDREAPDYAYGFANVTVNKIINTFDVEIGDKDVELFSGPGDDFKLDLVAKDSKGNGVVCEMAVVVVDEGVLALTRFVTPKYDNLMNFKFPLDVKTHELRKIMLLQTPFGYLHNEPLTGGGGSSLGKKKDPITAKIRKDFNPVAYFNASVITDSDGNASVMFKLPDTMTSYRVYTVACDKAGGFDSSERLLRVSKDFYIEPGIPRFMTKGDNALVLVSAFNKTSSGGVVNFTTESDKYISLTADKSAYSLDEFERGAIPVRAEAKIPGMSELTFSGEFKGLSDIIQVKVPVNLGYPMDDAVLFGKFTNDTPINAELKKTLGGLKDADIGPGEVTALLTFSDTPFIRLTQGLKYLLQYPYGCVEQTSSRIIGLAGLLNNIKNGSIPQVSTEEAEKFITPGINRLLTMQISSGGFGYWPGNRHPHDWGTIYALTALTLSKDAGIDVPQSAIDAACGYMKKQLKIASRYEYKAFAIFLLARNGKLDRSDYNKTMSDYNSMPQYGKLLTLLAGKLSGFETGDSLKQKFLDAQKISDTNYSYRGFYAPYRKGAIALIAAREILGEHTVTDEYAQEIIAGIQPNGRWISTSDTGWCLFALGEYFEGTVTSDKTATVTVTQDGLEPKKHTLEYGKSVTIQLDEAALINEPKVSIDIDSDKTIMYRLTTRFPRVDIGRDGFSNGFTIEKKIENTKVGKPIRVGDIVKVKVNVTVPYKDRWYSWGYRDYIVIDDPLPAGLVAVNSALKSEEPLPDQKTDNEYYWYSYMTDDGFYRFVPNYFEMRDDRVLAFRDRCWRGSYQYSYYARAIVEGDFVVPSTKVMQMYRPKYRAFTPKSTLRIEAMPNGK